MKIFRTIMVGRRCCAAPISTRADRGVGSPSAFRWPMRLGQSGSFALPIGKQSAFTLIEVAICLAIIGIALVGIIVALPIGLNTSRDNREETIIAQDANVLLELIRNGSHGPDDLTNYVYAIKNSWTLFNPDGSVNKSGVNDYDYLNASVSPVQSTPPYKFVAPINTGSNIISLLSTPEFTDLNGEPLASFINGGYSNHVFAYVRSLSGLAAEKPPQRNSIMQENSFSYRILCVNAPLALDTPPLWKSQPYRFRDRVTYVLSNGQIAYAEWLDANNYSLATDDPSTTPTKWTRNFYSQQLAASQREIRLKFLWPQLPNGKVGANYQNFRATVGGQLVLGTNFSTGHLLYFYQSQSFTKAQ